MKSKQQKNAGTPGDWTALEGLKESEAARTEKTPFELLFEVLQQASKEDTLFIRGLLELWAQYDGGHVPALALEAASKHFGLYWLGEDIILNTPALLDDFETLHLVACRRHWLARFISTVLSDYTADKEITPSDVLERLLIECENFNVKVASARDLLRRHPDAVKSDLADLAQKRPELLRPEVSNAR